MDSDEVARARLETRAIRRCTELMDMHPGVHGDALTALITADDEWQRIQREMRALLAQDSTESSHESPAYQTR
jgi:hypothetical protein